MNNLNVGYQFKEHCGVENEMLEAQLLFNGKIIGTAEMFLIAGGMHLADYLDQTDNFSPWVPYDAMLSIEFDGETGLTEKIGYIHHILIDEEYRGNGYSGYFLKELERIAMCKGMKTIILQACSTEQNKKNLYFSDSEKLKEFYERKGYQIFETKSEMRNPYHFKTLDTK